MFAVEHKYLSEFVRCVEKSVGVPDLVSVYSLNDDQHLCLYGSTPTGFGYIVVENTSKENIGVSIEAEKFFLAVKNMYAGMVSFDIQKNKKVLLKKDNIEVLLAVSARVKKPPTVEAYQIGKLSTERLVNALKRASAIVPDDSRFFGVLIDNKDPFCRVCNFSPSAIVVSTLDKIQELPNVRFAVPTQTVTAIGLLSKEISDLFFSENLFGFRFQNGTVVYIPKAVDTYPEQYLEQLQLTNDECPINANNFSVSYFNVNQLSSAASLVSSIIGAEEASINLAVAGASPEGNAVWKINSKSFTGSEVSEVVESLPGSSLDQLFVTVNKKQFLKILGIFGEKVALLLSVNFPALVFYDQGGRDIILLVKMA